MRMQNTDTPTVVGTNKYVAEVAKAFGQPRANDETLGEFRYSNVFVRQVY